MKKVILFFIFLLIGFSFSFVNAGNTDFKSKDFSIDTSTFSIGGEGLKDTTAENTINKTFGVFIKKMMIGLSMLSAFIMTIGAGYMILHYGQDEYLSRGKSIFKMGLISLIIALSSFYIVSLLVYVLYK